MKHTPSPWKLEKAYSWRIVNDDGVCVASPHGPQGEWGKVREEHTANAALIVAAPELLEALKNLLSLCKSEYPKSIWTGEKAWEEAIQAEKAIAKAEEL